MVPSIASSRVRVARLLTTIKHLFDCIPLIEYPITDFEIISTVNRFRIAILSDIMLAFLMLRYTRAIGRARIDESHESYERLIPTFVGDFFSHPTESSTAVINHTRRWPMPR